MDARLPPRFWRSVIPEPNSGCWLWLASSSRCKGGYGQVHFNGRGELAHRAFYTALVAPIPSGLVLDHLCRTTICVNPAHLEPVPQSVNIQRGGNGNRRKTHCPKGHAYEGENLIIVMRTERICRACATQTPHSH